MFKMFINSLIQESPKLPLWDLPLWSLDIISDFRFEFKREFNITCFQNPSKRKHHWIFLGWIPKTNKAMVCPLQALLE